MTTLVASDSEPKPEAGARPLSLLLRLAREFRWPLLILFAHVPMLAIHFHNMWMRPHDQYFPIVLLAAGALIYSRIEPRTAPRQSVARRIVVYALLAISLVLLVTGTIVVFSPWLASVAFVLACGAAMMQFSERFFVRNMFGIWILLWLLVALPGAYQQRLSQLLQRATTVLSGRILEPIGIPNLVDGTTLWLPGQQLFVEEACSGIVSMLSILASCLIVAVWANRPWVHTLLLVASGIAFAAVTNVLRIVAIAYAEVGHGIDLLHGWKHDLLGLCLFMVAVTLALSADRLLSFFLAPIENNWEGFETPRTWLARVWNWVANLGRPGEIDDEEEVSPTAAPSDDERSTVPQSIPRPIAIAWAGAFLLAGTTSLYAMSTRDAVGTALPTPEFVNRLAAESLSPADSWRTIHFGDKHADRLFAQNSRLWTYEKGTDIALFAVDFSFPHWHGLHPCYTSLGWDPLGPPTLTKPSHDESAVYLRSRYRKGSKYGLLAYCMIDAHGDPYDPPDAVSVAENMRRRFQEGQHTLYQVQLWVTSDSPFDDADNKSAQKLFETLREQLVTIVKRAGEVGRNGVRADAVADIAEKVDGIRTLVCSHLGAAKFSSPLARRAEEERTRKSNIERCVDSNGSSWTAPLFNSRLGASPGSYAIGSTNRG